MRNSLRMLLLLLGVLTPLAVQAAKPPNDPAAKQKQNPKPPQNQKQNPQQNQNQNGPNQTAQAIQYAVQQLMSLDKNQSGGIEANEAVNNQVLQLCHNADTDKNGSVTATEFTAALTSIATTASTAGGNTTMAVFAAAGCNQGNNQTATTGNVAGATARQGVQGPGQMNPQQSQGMQGQGTGPAMLRGPGGPGGGMQRGPGGSAGRR